MSRQQLESMEFVTPTGRLVQGHPTIGRDKDAKGRPLTTRDGQPRKEYYIGLALKKGESDVEALIKQIRDFAAKQWPGLNEAHLYTKIVDGDGHNDRGEPWSRLEGFAGHYVLRFSGGMPCTTTTNDGKQSFPGEQIKRGDYCRVFGNVRSNSNYEKPGIYMNHSLLNFDEAGPEIKSAYAPDAASVFGGREESASVFGKKAVPANPGFVQKAAGTPPPPPAKPKQPTMTAQAEGQSLQDFLDAGWTVEQVVENGFATW